MNKTTDKVLELESRFEMYKDCTINAIFYAPKHEMEEAVKYFNSDLKDGEFKRCHLYHPYELAKTEEFNYYFFIFKSERNRDLSIEVRSNEIHRLITNIVEI